MVLLEYLTLNNIFESLKNLDTRHQYPFLHDSDLLKNTAIYYYGDKVIFSKVITMNNHCPAIIYNLYSERWDKLSNSLDDILRGVTSVRELTETINDNETMSNNRTDMNKIAAYDDDDMVDNDATVSDGTTETQNLKTRTLKDSTLSPAKAYNSLSTADKNNIMNFVLSDVVSFLTISVY